jgi:hypothetical protein
MSTVQAFLLGIMVGWTPCLLVLGWFLWPGRLVDSPDRQNGMTQTSG